MKPGDCINIPAEVKHWHGAAPDEWFSHLAIEVPGVDCSNEWCGGGIGERVRWIKIRRSTMEYGKLGNTDIEEPYVPHEIVGAIDKNPAQGVILLDEKK